VGKRVREEKFEKRCELLLNRLNSETDSEIISKIKKLSEVTYQLKAVILIKVEKVYRTV